MTKTCSIAVAQTCPVKGDVPANVAEHIRLARLAATEGAQLVVFPELSLTGYELPLADQLAFCSDDSRLTALREVAELSGITLVVGAPLRIDSRLCIGAMILLPDRTIKCYTKRRLGTFPTSAACDSCDGSIPPPEPSVFQPGDHDPPVNVGDRTAAVAICADIGDPAHPQRAATRGAKIYLASMFVIPSDFDSETAKLSHYAAQHTMLTALANFGGPSGSLRSAGRSSIWSERGELLVQLDPTGSGIAVLSDEGHGRTERGMIVDH